MDLSDFAPKSDYITVILKNPKTDEPLTNDDGSEMSVDYWLPHSKEAQEVAYALSEDKVYEPDAKTTRKDLIDFSNGTFYGSIKSWDITWQGSKPEYTRELAEEVFGKLPALKGQVQEEAGNASGFMDA